MSYSQDPSTFTRIMTGDEAWMHYSAPSTKKQTMVWKQVEEQASKKVRMEKSEKRIMATVFWDQEAEGVL